MSCKAGMTFTIEPMVNAGKRHVRLLPRRLDRGHQGPLAVGAVGAHGAGHRDRRRSADARRGSKRPGSATDGVDSKRTSRRAETTVLRSAPWLRLAPLAERLAAANRRARGVPRRARGTRDAELAERFRADESVETLVRDARRARRRRPARACGARSCRRATKAGRWPRSAATAAASCIRSPTSTS